MRRRGGVRLVLGRPTEMPVSHEFPGPVCRYRHEPWLRSSFFLLVLTVLFLTTAQAAMAGLHAAYTRSLSACESPSVLAGDNYSPDGTEFLCALKHVRTAFFGPNSKSRHRTSRCAAWPVPLAYGQRSPQVRSIPLALHVPSSMSGATTPLAVLGIAS